MSLARFASVTRNVVTVGRASSVVRVPVVALSGSPLDKRERGMEKAYFNKQDEELMRKLLKKLKSQADVHDEHKAKGHAISERSALEAIVGKYKMSESDIAALIDWRHSDQF